MITQQLEMQRRVTAWHVAHRAVDDYVQINFPFTAHQVAEFLKLESTLYETALKLSESCLIVDRICCQQCKAVMPLPD